MKLPIGTTLALVTVAVVGVATTWGTWVTGARASGDAMVYESLVEGTGPSPTVQDVVRVHYRGTLQDGGKEFDSSYQRGEPMEFPLGRVIPCWSEGLQKMKVGGKARLTCPSGMAYGTRGVMGVIPPNATLTFEVELLGIEAR